jgi:protein ImuB
LNSLLEYTNIRSYDDSRIRTSRCEPGGPHRGPAGLRALRLARGEDELLVPSVHGTWEELVEEIELPEGTAGSQLERALELLVDRLLAAPRRKGRTLLGLRLGATLGDGGSWSVAQGLGRPTASARALRAVLLPRLEGLPAPAVSLRLRAAEQLELSEGRRGGGDPRGVGRTQLREVAPPGHSWGRRDRESQKRPKRSTHSIDRD